MRVLALIFVVGACMATQQNQYSGVLRQDGPGFDSESLARLRQFQEVARSVGLDFPDESNTANLRNMLTTFNKDTVPVLDTAVKSGLGYLTDITEAALPVLEQLTIATIPALTAYAKALKRYNREGGEFPQAPAHIIPFSYLNNNQLQQQFRQVQQQQQQPRQVQQQSRQEQQHSRQEQKQLQQEQQKQPRREQLRKDPSREELLRHFSISYRN